MDGTTKRRAAKIREFNRFYTNVIGLVNRTILDSPYSLAEVRVLLEIDKAGTCAAADLTKWMKIDAGYLSRMLTRFIRENLVSRTRSLTDKRAQVLSLTDKGRETFRKLSDASTQQVMELLEGLPEDRQERLVRHMDGIKDILSGQGGCEVAIQTGKPGDLTGSCSPNRSATIPGKKGSWKNGGS